MRQIERAITEVRYRRDNEEYRLDEGSAWNASLDLLKSCMESAILPPYLYTTDIVWLLDWMGENANKRRILSQIVNKRDRNHMYVRRFIWQLGDNVPLLKYSNEAQIEKIFKNHGNLSVVALIADWAYPEKRLKSTVMLPLVFSPELMIGFESARAAMELEVDDNRRVVRSEAYALRGLLEEVVRLKEYDDGMVVYFRGGSGIMHLVEERATSRVYCYALPRPRQDGESFEDIKKVYPNYSKLLPGTQT